MVPVVVTTGMTIAGSGNFALSHAAQRHQGLSGTASQLRATPPVPTARLRTSSAATESTMEAADAIAIGMRTLRGAEALLPSGDMDLSRLFMNFG
jgi:hypothetical protein